MTYKNIKQIHRIYFYLYIIKYIQTQILNPNSEILNKLNCTYDANGNRTKLQTLNSNSQIINEINYTYNALNQLLTLASSNPSLTFNFVYDSLGRRTKLLYPTGATANYIYDSAGRLTSLTHKTSKGHTIDKYKYTLDKVGNRLTKSSIDTEYTYKYDATYQLLQSIPTSRHHHNAETFAYDPVGNRITAALSNQQSATTYTHNAGNQLIEKTKERKHDEENFEYTYDKNGNLIKQVEYEHHGKHPKTTLYTYDYENRLIKIETQKHHWQQTVTFAYDPFGRRISKTIQREKDFDKHDHDKEHDKDCDKDDDDHEAIKITYYVYDNQDILMEYDQHGKIKAKYIHGSGIDEHLAVEKKGEIYYYHSDGLGSITTLTDKKQHIVQSYEYDSFGNMKQQGHKIKQPYTYTGREYDSETGLYYYRARYYDAKNGRFISKDPIGFAGGINRYVYVGNNSVNFIDPFGLHEVHYLPLYKILKPTYDRMVVTYDDNGIPANVSFGSINPDSKQDNCNKGCPTIESGTYKFKYDIKRSSTPKYPALRVNDGNFVPTLAPNPNQNYKSIMDGVWIHKGCTTRTCAEGCLTINPRDWGGFMKNFPKDSTGRVTVW